MPRSNTQAGSAKQPREDRSKRLLDLVVFLLGARSPVPWRELRELFPAYRTDNEGAGLRAFERDKADLLELGVPLKYVTTDEDETIDEPGYLVDLRRYRLPEIHFTADEVGALLLAAAIARSAPGTTYDEVVDIAVKKLAFDLPAVPDTPPSKQREPVLVHFPRQPGSEELAERLAVLEQAIRNRKRVSLDYVSPASGEPLRRVVDPYGLVYRQGAWLLVGRCHLREDIRSFRVDRMRAIAIGPKPKSPDFDAPTDFDVRRYSDRSPWTFGVEPALLVELEVLPHAGAVGNEDFGEGAVRQSLASGCTRIRFSCTNPEYLVARVLAAKGALIVRAPEQLQKRIEEELRAVEEKYD